MALYQKTDSETWTGRIDGTEPDVLRWHQVIHVCEPEQLPPLGKNRQGIAFIGFCCDEGVKRNMGRAGAAAGSMAIRKACCNFPQIADHIVMADAGDVICTDHKLEAAQDLLASKIAAIITAGYLPMVLGGGHETALCGYKALGKLPEKSSLGLINFDAHFDLRMVDASIGANSGTWAWQIAQDCKENDNPFQYLVLGVQPYSNTKRLFELALEMGVPYFKAEDFTNDQLHKMLNHINGIIANADHLLLSVDMDVFGSAYAPGVSAPSFNGIAPNAMFKRLLRHIVLSGKVNVIDISELNPAYDVDNRTARLAAAFVFDMVQAADINAEYPG